MKRQKSSSAPKKEEKEEKAAPGGKKGSNQGDAPGKKKGSDVEGEKVEKPKQLWTGKTPSTHLNEWCQRNRRPKPIWDQVAQSKDGFIWKVTVRGPENVAEKDKIADLTFQPKLKFPTAVEAKHAAAVVALHNYNAQLPMHRVLPPEYRDLWFQLCEDHKKAMEEKKIRDEEERVSAAKAAKEKLEKEKPQQRLPQVLMTEATRKMLEDLIKGFADYSAKVTAEAEREAEVEEATDVLAALAELGFQEKDSKDALRNTLAASTESLSADDRVRAAVDWMCLHVPEDRLPTHYGPAKGSIQLLNFASTSNQKKLVEKEASATLTTAQIAILEKMLTYGYSEASVRAAIAASTTSTELAVLKHLFEDVIITELKISSLTDSDAADPAALQEELEGLRSIYPDELSERQQPHEHIAVKIPHDRLEVSIEFHSLSTSSYRNSIPILTCVAPNLDPPLRLQITKRVAQEASDALGGPALFRLVSFLQDTLDEIVSSYVPPPKPTPSPTPTSNNANNTKEKVSLAPPTMRRERVIAAKRNRHARHSEYAYNHLTEAQQKKLNDDLARDFKAKQNDPAYLKLKPFRDRLPTCKASAPLLQLIESNQVVVVSGATGSGKSTQIPQLILDALIEKGRGGEANIICTQPRRISAIGIAERVSAERAEKIGGSVGYQVRLESRVSSRTRLLYCTTGILLRRLQGDMSLAGVSHVIIDEVHERSLEIDFLLVILKRMLSTRKDLKVVLMSASLNAELFASYFRANGRPAPTFDIPGTLFPVREFFLEDVIRLTHYSAPREELAGDAELSGDRPMQRIDMDLVESLLLKLLERDRVPVGSGILVFLPGMGDILNLAERMRAYQKQSALLIVPLHSSLSVAEQQRAFDAAPQGGYKLVLSTNIAETSVTIDDIVVVIDAGRMNQMQFDPHTRMPALEEVWISQANAKQRQGRAGRVQEGTCYKLFSRAQYERFAQRETPEIQRVPLEQICLQIKLLQLGRIADVLAMTIEPPQIAAIQETIKLLHEFRALEPVSEELTPLGYHLAQLPVSIHIGKLLLYGAMFKCIDPILTIAAALSSRSPFMFPLEKRKEAHASHMKFAAPYSDHLTLVSAYSNYLKADNENAFCFDNFLSKPGMKVITDLRRQFAEQLSEIGFLPEGISISAFYKVKDGSDGVLQLTGKPANINSQSVRMVKAVLTAGLYPNVVKVEFPETKYQQVLAGAIPISNAPSELTFLLKSGERVFIHPRSVNFSQSDYECPFLVFHEKVKTKKPYIVDSTMPSAYSLLLFGGELEVQHKEQTISIDGWMTFTAPARIAVFVRTLREELDALMQLKIANPHLDVANTALIDVITKLITTDGVIN